MESADPQSKKSQLEKKRYLLVFIFIAVIVIAAGGLIWFLRSEIEKVSERKETEVVEQGILYNISSSVVEVDQEKRRLLVLVTAPKAFPGHGIEKWIKVSCTPEDTVFRLVDLNDFQTMVSGGEKGKDLFSFIQAGDVFKGNCYGDICSEISSNCVVLREKLSNDKS